MALVLLMQLSNLLQNGSKELAELILVDEGCPKLNLQIRADNKKAINFYKAVGYNKDEVISFGKSLIED